MAFIDIKKTKLAIIGSVGVPASYGGFETLAEHLIDNLSSEYDITVYCSGKKYKKEYRRKTYKNAKLKYIPLEANGIQSIFYDTAPPSYNSSADAFPSGFSDKKCPIQTNNLNHQTT